MCARALRSICRRAWGGADGVRPMDGVETGNRAGVAAGSLGAASPASAALTPGDGVDISFPNCRLTTPPVGSAFAIVGVDGGRPFDTNPCLKDDVLWAGTGAAFYANTANPGPSSPNWPNGVVVPKVCVALQDSLECAEDYGWKAAADSYQKAVDAQVAAGLAPPGSTRRRGHRPCGGQGIRCNDADAERGAGNPHQDHGHVESVTSLRRTVHVAGGSVQRDPRVRDPIPARTLTVYYRSQRKGRVTCAPPRRWPAPRSPHSPATPRARHGCVLPWVRVASGRAVR